MQAYDYFFENGSGALVRIRRGDDWGIRFFLMGGFAPTYLGHKYRIHNQGETLSCRSIFLEWYEANNHSANVKQSNEVLKSQYIKSLSNVYV